jgi:uncharacterized protein (TIGR02246 family)
MKRLNQFKFATATAVLFFFSIGCSQTAGDDTLQVNADTTHNISTKADPAKLREEIQAMETAWSNADNARDIKKVAAFYADDAVSLGNNQPMMVGHAAIENDVAAYVGKRAKGTTVSYDVMDVFGCDNYVTEVGKTTRKDSTGKVFYTGKYMAVWEKRNGKWVCVRDIANDDVKGK